MIAPEGKIIIIPLIILVLIIFGINTFFSLKILKLANIIGIVCVCFSLYFFRDPHRRTPKEQGFLSPADGKIIQIIDSEDEELGSIKIIAIFLSIWDVHSQRVPLSARVISKKYNSGNFFAAFKQKASEFNEHSIVLFETERGKRFKIKQIAGLVARRIINYMEPNRFVNRGQRLGFIRFGSRVEILVPQDFQIDINVGDIVIGNYTILGRFL